MWYTHVHAKIKRTTKNGSKTNYIYWDCKITITCPSCDYIACRNSFRHLVFLTLTEECCQLTVMLPPKRIPLAFVWINVKSGAEDEAIAQIRRIKNVEEAYLIDAIYDIHAKVKAETMQELDEITNRIRRSDNVRSIAVCRVLEEPFFREVPVEDKRVDDLFVDESVYGYVVAHGGKISLTEAANDLTLTLDELKTAIGRLKKEGKVI